MYVSVHACDVYTKAGAKMFKENLVLSRLMAVGMCRIIYEDTDAVVNKNNENSHNVPTNEIDSFQCEICPTKSLLTVIQA